MNTNYQGPGVYRHYKGGNLYEVLGIAIKESTYDPGNPADADYEVVYRPLPAITSTCAGVTAELWARDLDNFNEEVTLTSGGGGYPDEMGPRFEKVGPLVEKPEPWDRQLLKAWVALGDLLNSAEAADDHESERILTEATELLGRQTEELRKLTTQ